MSSTVVPDAAADGKASLAKTPAQLMQEQHEAAETHHVTVEDVVDEDDLQHPPPAATTEKKDSPTPAPATAPMSAKAAGKQKASEKLGAIDTQDEEAFPALGPATRAPTVPRAGGWANAAAAKGVNTNGGSRPSSGAATPSSTPGVSTPTSAANRPTTTTLPGQATDQFEIENSEIDRSKNIRKIFDDVKRNYGVIVSTRITAFGKKTAFVAVGPKSKVTTALMHISKEVTLEKTSKLEIPASVTAQIIGKAGANIKKLQDKFGVKIHTDRSNRKTAGPDDMGTDIVEIKGHAAQVAQVENEITNQARQLQPKVDLPVRGIPPEFFPFIAGNHAQRIRDLEQNHGLNINIPQYHTWQARAPARTEEDDKPARFTPHGDSHIMVSGDQTAVKHARQELERLAERLHAEIMLEEMQAQQFLHPFIVGDRGVDPLYFLEQTGCTVVIPPSHHETEDIYILGPQDKIEKGRDFAENLMAQKFNQNVNLQKQFSDAPHGPERHSRALAQYLQRKAIEREFQQDHSAELVFPNTASSTPTWTVITDESKKALSARSELSKITQAFPTPRLQLVEIDPFFHQHLEQRHAQQLQQDLGVHLMVPTDGDEYVVLVSEGPQTDSPFQIPRSKPSKQEIAEFQKALQQAQDIIMGGLPSSGIITDNVEVPRKFHDKLRRHVKQEQRSSGDFPVQIDFGGSRNRREQAATRGSPNVVELRHPEQDAVDAFKQMLLDFLKEAEQDEKERGYVTTLHFPAKYNKNLIGRGGAKVNELREKHDVDIQVSREGGDEIKIQGPQKKAEACKAEIAKMLKQFEDEVNYVLKIDPKFHGQLVGRNGENLRKIQRNNKDVRIDFPRASKAGADDQSDAASEVGNRPSQPSNEVRIRGPRAQADDARGQLLDLQQWIEENSHTATVSVAQDQVGKLIGRNGQELEKLRAETNAQIDVPKTNGAQRVEITIRGSKKAVQDAKAEIQKRSKAFDSVVTKEIEVESKHRQAIIGAGGESDPYTSLEVLLMMCYRLEHPEYLQAGRLKQPQYRARQISQSWQRVQHHQSHGHSGDCR
jgi:predicted PilT family ATPase